MTDIGISPKLIHGKYIEFELELINPVLNFPKKDFLFTCSVTLLRYSNISSKCLEVFSHQLQFKEIEATCYHKQLWKFEEAIQFLKGCGLNVTHTIKIFYTETSLFYLEKCKYPNGQSHRRTNTISKTRSVCWLIWSCAFPWKSDFGGRNSGHHLWLKYAVTYCSFGQYSPYTHQLNTISMPKQSENKGFTVLPKSL